MNIEDHRRSNEFDIVVYYRIRRPLANIVQWNRKRRNISWLNNHRSTDIGRTFHHYDRDIDLSYRTGSIEEYIIDWIDKKILQFCTNVVFLNVRNKFRKKNDPSNKFNLRQIVDDSSLSSAQSWKKSESTRFSSIDLTERISHRNSIALSLERNALIVGSTMKFIFLTIDSFWTIFEKK